MVVRKVITVKEEKCDGCGMCIPNCPEGAMKIVNGKLVITDGLCDGLGACVGACPKGALQIAEKDTYEFNDEIATKNIKASKRLDDEITRQHLEKDSIRIGSLKDERLKAKSSLSQWPVKFELVPPTAPFLNSSKLLVTADCVPFAYRDFHKDFLEGKKIFTGCPKFGNVELYLQKLIETLKKKDIKSLEVLRMEVPCCSGLTHIAEEAVKSSGKNIGIKEIIISIDGKILAAPRGVKCCP